jgi:acyl-CoA reductase-like NAD-dependent aldehyde dehydrogenase
VPFGPRYGAPVVWIGVVMGLGPVVGIAGKPPTAGSEHLRARSPGPRLLSPGGDAMTPAVPHLPLLLASERPAHDAVEVTAPWDGSVIATIERAGPEHVDEALAVAEALARDRERWLPKPERIAILQRASALVTARREELARQAAHEGGKPMVDSLVEVDRAANSLELCARALAEEAGREVPMRLNAASADRLALTIHEPIGVVVAISAFNHPLNLIAHQVGPAVAAGCPFVVKPAEDTPVSCWRVVEILREAGLPAEWGQALMTRDVELAQRLATDPRVAFLTFIGSARVGWTLRSKLAPGARCALEHGGAAPVVVAEDADLDDLVPRIAKGGLYHAGQVCVSVQRVLALPRIVDELAERLAVAAREMRVGDPLEMETDVGPLIRPREVERVDEWVKEAVAGGAAVLAGGEPIGERAYAPTILRDPPPRCRVSTEEIFGPVVAVSGVASLEEAIARANALPYAFQSAVFTRDIDTAMRTARRLDASAVMVNDHTAFRVDWMPFAGLRRSGLGVGGIPHTFRDMRIEKMIVIRTPGL